MTFSSPNYTQVPNELLDTLMAIMGDAELRVVLCVTRRTIGYHKESDPISWSQIMDMTGLSRTSTGDGIEQAIAHGYIELVGHGQRGMGIYKLAVDWSTYTTTTSSAALPMTGSPTLHTKETEKEKKNISASRTRDRSYMNIDINRPTPALPTSPDGVLNSELCKYVIEQCGKSALINKRLQDELSGHTKVQVGNEKLIYDSPVTMFAIAPPFKEFVIERVKMFQNMPSPTRPQDILKNICRVDKPPVDENGRKQWPGYHYWLQSRMASYNTPDKTVMDYGAPPDEVQDNTD